MDWSASKRTPRHMAEINSTRSSWTDNCTSFWNNLGTPAAKRCTDSDLSNMTNAESRIPWNLDKAEWSFSMTYEGNRPNSVETWGIIEKVSELIQDLLFPCTEISR
jgi:hypothetical protein